MFNSDALCSVIRWDCCLESNPVPTAINFRPYQGSYCNVETADRLLAESKLIFLSFMIERMAGFRVFVMGSVKRVYCIFLRCSRESHARK